MQTHEAVHPLRPSDVEGSDKILDPFENVMWSNAFWYVIAPFDNVFTASANYEHFLIISDAEREFTDMQSARPFYFSSAFRTRTKAIVHDFPI